MFTAILISDLVAELAKRVPHTGQSKKTRVPRGVQPAPGETFLQRNPHVLLIPWVWIVGLLLHVPVLPGFAPVAWWALSLPICFLVEKRTTHRQQWRHIGFIAATIAAYLVALWAAPETFMMLARMSWEIRESFMGGNGDGRGAIATEILFCVVFSLFILYLIQDTERARAKRLVEEQDLRSRFH